MCENGVPRTDHLIIRSWMKCLALHKMYDHIKFVLETVGPQGLGWSK